MKYKIGIFGSSAGDLNSVLPKAHTLGKILAQQHVIVLTGAAQGLPYEIASTAFKNGAEVWGYSQFVDAKIEKETLSDLDFSVFKKIFYIPKDFEFASNRFVSQKYRNVTTTATCDAGIIISGRWGSMNEFTNLYDMEKVIGVLTGTGGIADELEDLKKKIDKPKNAVVIFNNDPEKLVKQILAELAKRS
jgi:predicted Rossmann-fold nucleotide-binding protein